MSVSRLLRLSLIALFLAACAGPLPGKLPLIGGTTVTIHRLQGARHHLLFTMNDGDVARLYSADFARGVVTEVAQAKPTGDTADVFVDPSSDLILLSDTDSIRLFRAEKLVQQGPPLDSYIVSAELISQPGGTLVVAITTPRNGPRNIRLVEFTAFEPPRVLADLGKNELRETLGVLDDGSVLVETIQGVGLTATTSVWAVGLDGTARSYGPAASYYNFEAALVREPTPHVLAIAWATLNSPATLQSLDLSTGRWEEIQRFGTWAQFAPRHAKDGYIYQEGGSGPLVGRDAPGLTSPIAEMFGLSPRIAWSPDDAILAGTFGGLGENSTLGAVAADGTQLLRVDSRSSMALTLVGWSGSR